MLNSVFYCLKKLNQTHPVESYKYYVIYLIGCEVKNIHLETVTIEKLETIYPEASKKYSHDQSFKKI